MSVTIKTNSSGLFTPTMLCGLALVGLIVQLALPVSTYPSAGVSARAPHAAAPTIPMVAPLPDYPALLLRPLFSPEGEGGGTNGAGASSTTPQGGFTLLGVASAAGRASAVLRGADGGLHTLRLGEALGGWRLVAVGGDRASLRREGRVQDLRVGAAASAATTAR